jgi:hypothetical protein
MTVTTPGAIDPDVPQTKEEADELAQRALKKMGAAQVHLTRTRDRDSGSGTSKSSSGRPYLVPAVTRLRLVPKYHESLMTAGVDACWRLYFNPVFVMKSSIELLSAIIEHEIWHLLLAHHRVAEKARIPKWAATVWNIAADCEIHNDESLFDRLTKNGFEGLNHKRIGCPRQKDLIAYYNELMKRTIIYKTVQSHEVYINHQMPQEEYDFLDQEMGGISVIYRGPKVI